MENVPTIRACPCCYTLIEHLDYCKHVLCPKPCNKEFCFVCLSVKKGGKFACGLASDTCSAAPR